MHHFGCVVPSYEALSIIAQTAITRNVVEIGSGNGYWTYMLRRLSVKVTAVDNIQSEYRTLWIGDTIPTDGEKYLDEVKGAKDAVLLLVYPIVGQDFTSRILNAYKGNTICIAGTQNRNGYTAFRDRTVEEYMAAEKPEFRKYVQVALPSFAGKDEALFVFKKNVEKVQSEDRAS